MHPVVSVVIPTYNHAEYVLDTLASVFGQTFTDYEIIVVNDGSPDDTTARLRPLAEAGRVRYFEQANAGQAVARNRGFAEARGEFIAFLDDDDLWPPDKLAWQVAAMREHPEWAMLSGLSGLLGADGVPAESHRADDVLVLQPTEEMFEGSGIHSPGQVLIRRDALAAVGGFDPKLWGSDDMDLWIRLSAQGVAAQIRRTALYYRVHGGNASHAIGRMFWNAVRTVRKNLRLLPRDRRGQVWHSALMCIYAYSGTRIMKAARHGGFRARWAALRVVAYLLPAALHDPGLIRTIAVDLEPDWFQAMRARSKRVRAK